VIEQHIQRTISNTYSALVTPCSHDLDSISTSPQWQWSCCNL